MGSIGTGYDLSASTYSPDGRIFQVEYAVKAVENSGTCIGIRAKDGVVLAHEKLVQSKLLVPGSNRRIQTVDQHIGMVGAGLLADSRHLVTRARQEAANYKDNYKSPIPSKGYNGCAVGKGKQVAKTEIEKLKFTELTAREAVKEAARIIHFVHDEAKDKSFELELTWICDESKGMHQVVPAELAAEAVRLAKAALADEMDED
ncbi:putative proteasome subunit alpha type-7 [Batrachochytrium dendrobatidis]